LDCNARAPPRARTAEETMLSLFRSRRSKATIRALYGAIVAHARLPSFYATYGVPDTAMGRFDMIVLHLWLVQRRLASAELRHLGQSVFDLFCRDMDDNLREMGVSDLGVPKVMRRLGEAFYGRAQAYDLALAGSDAAALAAALARNIYEGASFQKAARLAAYVRAADGALAGLGDGALGAAALNFPDPEAIAAPAEAGSDRS
jgi:cytochrome b pre-mRNA-processing protein 3